MVEQATDISQRTTRTAWWGLVLLLVCLTGCGDPLAAYYPLSVTNFWIYDVEAEGGGSRKAMEQVIRRQDDKYTFNNGEVLLYLPNQALMNKQGVTILEKDMSLGHEWIDAEMHFAVTGKNQQVTAPAGTFDKTLEVTWTTKYAGDVEIGPQVAPQLEPGPNPRVFIYITTYAKGVGKIREEYITVQPDGTRTVEFVAQLVEYGLREQKKKLETK